MRKITPQPEYFTDDTGRLLVRLPVAGSDRPATAEAAMFDNAKGRLGLTGRLYLSNDGSGKSSRTYVVATVPGRGTHHPLARLLLDCPRGYHVRYNDGNPLNLLPENFRLVVTWAAPDTRAEVLDQLVAVARQPLGDDHAEG